MSTHKRKEEDEKTLEDEKGESSSGQQRSIDHILFNPLVPHHRTRCQQDRSIEIMSEV